MPAIDRISPRGGTAAEWTAANPILRARELGVETDTRKSKYGDGATAWDALPYASEPFPGSTFGRSLIDDADAAAARATLGLDTAPAVIAPALAGAWVDYAGGVLPSGYRKGAMAWVALEGLVADGADGLIFTLPAGFRPPQRLIFDVRRDGGITARLDVLPDGSVEVSGSGGAWLSLSGAAFYATA